MLITGYFGAHLSVKRFNKIYSIIYICSITSLIIGAFFETPTLMLILKHLIPVTSKRWWYASCYIFTLLLSPFLDLLAEKMNKKTFQALLLTLISLFYILPTFLYFDIMEDKGKGLVHMIVIYLLGRYLRKYPIKINNKKLLIALVLIIAFCCVGNVTATFVRGATSWPFSRDCTITTLAIALISFLIALNTSFYSKSINTIASTTLYMFLLSLYKVFKNFIPIESLASSKIYVLACIGYTLMILIISFIVAEILKYPAMLIEKILEFVENLAVKIFNKYKNKPFILKIKTAINNSINNEENTNV
jgi:hypothetical protein